MDDLDLALASDPKLPQPNRQGRRAHRPGVAFDTPEPESPLDLGSPLKARPPSGVLLLDEGPRVGQAVNPFRGRRAMGGWSEERTKTAKSVRIQSAAQHISAVQGDYDEDPDEGDIPIIPDLDDVQDEDMALQVAEAPSVAVNRVATYRELDNDLLKHVAFATLDDIDLKLLTHSLAPEHKLKEPDELWTWDVIFAEVTGDLQKEWYPEQEENEKAAAANERPYTAFNRFPV